MKRERTSKFGWRLAALIATCAFALLAPPLSATEMQVACKVPGYGTGLWVDGQDPRRGDRYSATQARERLGILSQYTSAIRLYGAQSDAEAACIAKNEFGMKVVLGAWIDRNYETNELEIAAAIAAANTCSLDILIGNEALLRGDVSAQYLIGVISRVKAQVPPGTRVGTADVWEKLVENKALIDASDVVLAHAHAYWAGVPIENAVAHAAHAYDTL